MSAFHKLLGVVSGSGSSGPAPVVLKPLVWTNLQRQPTFDSGVATTKRYRGRVLGLTGFAGTRIRLGLYSYSSVSSDISTPVAWTISRAALEIAGGYIPIKFGGADGVSVDPASAGTDGIIWSDWMLPADLVGGTPFAQFAADQQVYTRFKAEFPAGSEVPLGALSRGQSQDGRYYDVADEATSGDVYATGAYVGTPASLSYPSGNLGVPFVLEADPVDATAKSVMLNGDSVADGLGDNAWSSSGLSTKTGFGYIDRATADASNQNVIALNHSTKSGERMNQWITRAVGKTECLFDYANIAVNEFGTNDIAAGASAPVTLAEMQADRLTLWAMQRAHGIQWIIELPLLPRTNNTNTAPINSRFATGGQRDQFNAWVATQVGVGNGPDAIAATLAVAQKADDAQLWAFGYGDGTHPTSSMTIALAVPVREAILAAVVNGSSTVITNRLVTPPSISGTAQVGSTLTRVQGSYSPTPSGNTGYWRADGVQIGGATASTYVLQVGDVGKLIDWFETATFASGSPVPSDSADIGPITASGSPVNTVLPVVTGTTQTGQTLTTSNGTWSNSPTGYTYAWLVDGVLTAITTQTYAVQAGDIGKQVVARVTAANASGSTSADSLAVGPITVGAAGTVLFEDNFTPPGGSSVNLPNATYVTLSGHHWTKDSGINASGTLSADITNGRTYSTTIPSQCYVNDFSIDATTDFDVVATIDRRNSITNLCQVYICNDATAHGATGIRMSYSNSTNAWTFSRLGGSSPVTIGSSYTQSPGVASLQFKIKRRGTTVSLEVETAAGSGIFTERYTNTDAANAIAGTIAHCLQNQVTGSATGATLTELKVLTA